MRVEPVRSEERAFFIFLLLAMPKASGFHEPIGYLLDEPVRGCVKVKSRTKSVKGATLQSAKMSPCLSESACRGICLSFVVEPMAAIPSMLPSLGEPRPRASDRVSMTWWRVTHTLPGGVPCRPAVCHKLRTCVHSR
jgi:hypothetical protein